ncbi:MAG: FHA domain-containing protein [Planctomycetes bacterium]|nr:FHA domain-containing protein [Planctomycetota bacterium]
MPLSALFHLAVDDGGEFLVFAGESLVLGHLRSNGADLRFLADVESEHARLERHESFHGGVEWRVEPLGSASVRVNGVALSGARALVHGDRLQLGRNLGLAFRALDSASSSAFLELEGQAECEGARHVLLFSQGPSGRVRIGSKRHRPIPVPELEREVVLELAQAQLLLRCSGGLACGALRVSAGPQASLALELPIRSSLFVETGARAVGRAPFTLALRPSEHSRAGSTS